MFFVSFTFSQVQIKDTLTFSPLPFKKKSKIIEEFLPLFSYVEKISDIKTRFHYEQDYGQIIKKFTEGKIDIALLGPLPFAKLNQIYKYNKPIITFKQNNGANTYRCVIAKYGPDTIDFNNKLKVSLTQPLSTCGYYMTNILLKEQYNIKLQNQKYKYTNSHVNALIGVLSGEFDIAGVKDNIAHGFKSLGMKIVKKSEKLPGFSLVVNTKTVSKKQIKIIQELILSIPQNQYKGWSGISSNGFIKSDVNMYDNIKIDFENIPMSGNINDK